MGSWREYQEERRDTFNISAFNRCEDRYLTPPDDIECEDQEEYLAEMADRRFERSREEKWEK